jgi:hydrogenase nickel incorporation protein HypA/HybF
LHELGIAQSIVDAAVDEADKAKAKRVISVDVEVGELMQLDVKALEGALKLLMTGPKLEDAEVEVRVINASFSCRRCGKEWGMGETKRQLAAVPDDLRIREPDSVELPLHFLPHLYPSFVKCPSCGSSDTSATRGEDIHVTRVVLD